MSSAYCRSVATHIRAPFVLLSHARSCLEGGLQLARARQMLTHDATRALWREKEVVVVKAVLPAHLCPPAGHTLALQSVIAHTRKQQPTEHTRPATASPTKLRNRCGAAGARACMLRRQQHRPPASAPTKRRSAPHSRSRELARPAANLEHTHTHTRAPTLAQLMSDARHPASQPRHASCAPALNAHAPPPLRSSSCSSARRSHAAQSHAQPASFLHAAGEPRAQCTKHAPAAPGAVTHSTRASRRARELRLLLLQLDHLCAGNDGGAARQQRRRGRRREHAPSVCGSARAAPMQNPA